MASGSADIEMLLAYLKSSRVTDRRKAINELSEIITSKNIRDCINNSSTYTWNILLGNSQIAIKKECERLFDQDRSGLKCNKDKHFSKAASFFLLIVKTALKEGVDRINIPKLISYICGSLQENSMRICTETFLTLIKDYILINVNCLGCLKHDHFEQLFSLLKSEFLRLATTENNSPTNDLYNCICLLVKHGPLSGFPQSFFREQFEFISNIGQSVLDDHSRQLHEMAIEIVLNFCIHNAEDNRISCVELGEKVLSNFFNLYFTVGRDSVFKVNFIEFCLLQMVLHHPKGVPENDSRSHALNWHDWNSYVKRIYGILNLEITQYLQQYVKNTLLFQNQKKTVVILGSLVNLFVEVFKQLVTSNESNLDSSVIENDTTFSQAQKKRKITAITTESIINEIASTQSWVWVKLLGAAIKKYPELIDKDLFINLIQTLHKLHLDVSDNITISYIYEALIILIDIESQLGFSNEYAIINLWKLMGESALRIIGLNQNLQETNIFLRILILRNIVNIDSVIVTFTSGVLVITEHHIDTLKIILEKVNFSKLELIHRQNIFNCLLNIQTLNSASRSVLNPNFARIIVALSLKQCPEFEEQVENRISKDFTEKVVDVYERIHFASFTAIRSAKDSSDRNKLKINRIYTVDCNAMNLLTEKLNILVELCETEPVSNIFCLIGLLYNILSCLVDYQIIDISQVEEHFLLAFIKRLLQLEKTKIFQTYHSHKRSVLNELIKICGVLQDIFNLNNSVTGLVKDLFTQDFLRELMQVLQYFQCEVRDSENLEIELQIKKLLISLLTKFCVVSNRNEMSSNQKLLISALAKPDYDFFSENDYDLSISLLENAVLAQPGFLPSEVIADLLEGLRGFCTIKYRNYQCAEHIIKVLTTLFPHLCCDNGNCYKTKAIELIYPFFKRRSHYGSDLSECILNAIKELCRVDPNFRATKWEGKELIKYVPEFLCSDFQRIRHKAVDVLVLFFNTASNSGDIEAIHFLEEIFESIYNWNMKVFEIECELTDARKRDEVTLRASSALYPFIALLINCTDWAEESFFAIAKLEKVKQLFKVMKGDLMNRALLLIENYYNTDNSKIIFIEYILTKWISLGYSINDLECRLFGCPNKINLYTKYFDICSSLLINVDREDLISAGAQLNMTEKDVLEHCCTKNFSRMISVHVNSLEAKFIENNSQLSYIVQQLGGRFKEVLIEKIDELILVLLGGVSDVKNFQNLLNETICFISKGISINEYERCLHYIENLLCNNQNIIEFLNIKRKNKIQQIILNLQTAVYKNISINHQLRRFHQYIIFTNQLLKSITYDPTMTTFFIRDTLYFLINLNNNIQVERLQKVSLKYLNYFLKQILPNNVVEFKQFLNLVVNSLKNIAVHNEKLSSLCIDMLKFIIVENSYYLNDCMSKLDVFPSTFMFKDIKDVHDKFKYRENDTTLKDEIQSFLEYTDLATKQNSLKNLKIILSKEKQQLKELYDELNEMKGFSEDCENSILHKLTIVLIELARFPNNEHISDEAMRCLGELGPADLTTVILKPEKGVLAIQCSPSELFHGHILSILTQYIVDPDIKVAAASSSALYRLLNSNEGKKVLKNQNDFGYGVINKQFVIPYILVDSAKYASNLKISFENFLMLVDNSELWIPTSNLKSSKEWIRELVLAFLGSFNTECYITNLSEVCKAKDKFCEQILALLIYLFISLNDDRVIEVLAKNINKFFAQHWEMTKENNKIQENNNSITVNKKALKSILDVINFLRQQTNLIEKIEKLKFNYLSIAKAASYCSSHFSALLYAELWCKEKINDVDLSNKFENDSNIVDYIYENVPQDVGIVFQQILQESYRSIGDLDALLGCGVSLLLRPEYRVEYYKYTEQWSSVMDYYSTLPLSKDSNHHQTESAANLVQSLKMNNFHQLVLYNDKIEYECLWRLGQWDVIEKDDNTISKITNNSVEFRYDKNKFYCLKSLCENDNYTYSITKKELTSCLIDKLKQASLEGSKNLYPIFTNLQSLVEIEDCFEAVEQKNFTNIFKKWKIQDSIIRKNAFQYVEPIIAQRLTLLREFIKLNPNLKQAYIDLSLNYSDYARNELRLKEAVTAINNIRHHILDLDVNIENEIQFREAQLAWLKNDKRIAKKILRKLCTTSGITPKLEANCLMLQGIYMAETYSDRTSVLQHFEAAIEIYKKINCSNVEDYYNFQNVYDKIAMFADREYQQIMNYINSDSFQKKLSNIRSCKEMARALKDQREKSNDEKRALIFHEKQIRFDENEVATTLKEKTVVLELALKYYIKNLSLCDTNNIKIFRIVALFLENRDNKESLALLNELFNQIPSYKYVTVLPQLIPHITSNQTDLFGKHVNRIIEKCALDHPHHTLPLLLALVKADKDKEFSSSSSSTTKKNTNERTTVAIHLVKKLMRNEKLNEIIKKMLQLSDALIELAYFVDQAAASSSESNNSRKNDFNIPSKLKICKLNDLQNILVPTYSLPISKANNYDRIMVGIVKFGRKYKTVGGINAPKCIECFCTSGQVHSQLVKGHDDLRQDAVMQQVFNIMNNLFAANKQTKSLSIRTYKIVPLSMRSGILEWVANTIPIGDYLSGSSGAHKMFRPKDKSINDCRAKFRACAEKPVETKLKVYNSICKEIRPVFHKFFETHFRQPSVWYERRRAYIHSVATTSMVGYILGIGDRHVSNILIDKKTAEVIHIDFGIAFEQGICLPTPETVPFRLTRDLVDGMGVSGVEGLFRKSCEKTMEVLKSNSQTILTILEVLLYDPLYFWTVSIAEARKRQTDGDVDGSIAEDVEEENKNISAERALLRLRAKLGGTENGKSTSVEHQVERLIQQAVDPFNLCRLFNGWQPYL